MLVSALVCVLGFFANVENSFAQSDRTILILSDSGEQYDLQPYIETLPDPSGKLTIDDVTSLQYAAQFKPISDIVVATAAPQVVWMRFTVRNQAASSKRWLLQFAQVLPQVDFFRPYSADNKFDTSQTGIEYPLNTREIPHATFLFRIEPGQNETQTYYARIRSLQAAVLAPTLWESNAFAAHDQLFNLAWGLVYGALLIFTIYNVLLFLSLRERSYLYLAWFLGTLILAYILPNGQWALLRPNDPLEMYPVIYIIVAMLFSSLLLFANSFLETAQRQPQLYRFSLAIIILLYAAMLANIVTASRFWFVPQLVLGIAALFLVLVMSFVSWRRGFASARYVFFAGLLPFALGILDMLIRVGLFSPFPNYSLTAIPGMVMFALLLTYSLSDRIKLLRAQQAEANNALRASERKLHQYLDSVPFGLSIYDTALKPLYIKSTLDDPIPEQTDRTSNYVKVNQQVPVYIAGTDTIYPLEKIPLVAALREQKLVHIDNMEVQAGERRIPVEVWAQPIFDEQGKIEGTVSSFVDITERRTAEQELARYREHLEELVLARTAELHDANAQTARLFHQEQQARTLAESLQRVATVLNSSLDEQDVLSMLLMQLQSLIPSDGAAVYLLEGDALVLSDAVGGTQLRQEKIPTDASHNPVARVFADARAEVMAHTENNENRAADQTCTKSWMGAPLIVRDQVLGVLSVERERGTENAFDELQLGVLQTFANQAAIAVLNARLYSQAHNIAVTEERERLAREMHDAVTQTLFSANIVAEAIPLLWKQDPNVALSNVEKLRQLTRGALAEMRTLLVELRPTAITHGKLDVLLRQLAEASTVRTRVPVSVEIDKASDFTLPPEVQVVFYRTAQEALNNIAKHAQAQHVQLGLVLVHDCLRMQIRDDGIGFDTAKVSPDHMGLSIMQERAAQVGAEFEMHSGPGGTEIILCWHTSN